MYFLGPELRRVPTALLPRFLDVHLVGRERVLSNQLAPYCPSKHGLSRAHPSIFDRVSAAFGGDKTVYPPLCFGGSELLRRWGIV